MARNEVRNDASDGDIGRALGTEQLDGHDARSQWRIGRARKDSDEAHSGQKPDRQGQNKGQSTTQRCANEEQRRDLAPLEPEAQSNGREDYFENKNPWRLLQLERLHNARNAETEVFGSAQ